MKPLVLLVALSMTGAAVAQNDPLETARELYAAAACEEALSELTRIGKSVPEPAAAHEVDAYRAFCLMALGRTSEAESVAESLICADPTLTIDKYSDASPRIASMFTTVRKRVLPQLIRDEYRSARALAAAKSPEAEAR